MKRIIAIPLLLIYALVFSGAVIKMHYCGGELAAWNINSEKSICCCETSNSDNHSDNFPEQECCSDKVIAFELPQEKDYQHHVENNWFWLFFTACLAPTYSLPQHPVILFSESIDLNKANAPPNAFQQVPLYKLHHSFLFYG